MKKLSAKAYPIAALLLLEFQHQSIINTILSGSSPGHVYVNCPKNPTIAFAQFKHRTFISGTPPTETAALEKFFLSEVVNNCHKAGVPLLTLTANNILWLPCLKKTLAKREPLILDYQCYRYHITDPIDPIWVPEAFNIQIVDEALLQENFANKQDLLEEMCSERESVEAFLKNSFGIAAFKENSLAGWCLSEYNHLDRCEVGIATLSPYQRLGLGKAMTQSFLRLAQKKGIKTILWHCYKSNEASWRTALSVGFHLVEDHPILVVYLNTAVNLAVHGNIKFDQKKYAESLVWYKRALSENDPPPWIAWKAGCAASLTGQIDYAFEFLNITVDLGFTNQELFSQSEHLRSLHHDPRWRSLLARLSLNQQTDAH